MRGLIILKRPVCPGFSAIRNRLWFSSSTRYSAIPLRKSLRENPHKLPDTPCRTRFAPSPTGYLHLGSLRTALYNYLLAKATGGQFILRIEDTDRTRLVPDAEKRLFKDLNWAGLTWDEGPDIKGPYGPYRQSERLKIYDEHADQLIHEGKAYRCFCSPEDLEHHKHIAHSRGEPTYYPGTCRNISQQESEERAYNGEPFAVRFKSAEKPMVMQDIVYGRYQKAEAEDDFIIRKRDGFPTYHFANVVDDKLMKITHVIRGAEWLISTPKHVEMYSAFGWEPPAFAHVGLLVDKDRRKLSKRDSGVDMSWYIDRHILPETLLNFAVLLGWGKPASFKGDVMTLQEMVSNFAPKFSKGDIIVSLEKLHHLQTKHLRRIIDQDPPNLTQLELLSKPISILMNWIDKERTDSLEPSELSFALAKIPSQSNPNNTNIPIQSIPKLAGPILPHIDLANPHSITAHVRAVLQSSKVLPAPETGSLEQFLANNWYLFFTMPKSTSSDNGSWRTLFDLTQSSSAAQKALEHLGNLRTALWKLEESKWSAAQNLEALVKECIPPSGDETKFFYSIIRWALTGREHGPSIVDVVRLVGKPEALRRLEKASRGAAVCVDRLQIRERAAKDAEKRQLLLEERARQ